MKDETQVYDIQKDQRGTRLDRFLIDATEGVSRTYLQRLIRDGDVTVNGEVGKQPSYVLRDGDRVCLTLPPRALWTLPNLSEFHSTFCTRIAT